MTAVGQFGHVVVDCANPDQLAEFWCTMLDTTVQMRWNQYVMLRPTEKGGVALAFQRVPEPKSGKNRMHLDLIVTDGDLPKATQAAVAAGATVVSSLTEDPVTITVLQDPEGNEFCLVLLPPRH
jgi:predicted enzyme related to lactoylglutathione lyase